MRDQSCIFSYLSSSHTSEGACRLPPPRWVADGLQAGEKSMRRGSAPGCPVGKEVSQDKRVFRRNAPHHRALSLKKAREVTLCRSISCCGSAPGVYTSGYTRARRCTELV